MEHTWSFFIIFANKNIAQTSPQEGTLKSFNVYVPHQRHLKIMPFFSWPTTKAVSGDLGRYESGAY
jgi:hypothetical protein